jgi:2-iminobutanoate/2-iminopropanoate deaminase
MGDAGDADLAPDADGRGALVSDFQFPWAAGWHFSQAVRAGDIIVTAGQAGFDDDGRFVGEDFEAQFRQAFRNLDRVLRTQGSSLDGVMRLNTYLSDAAQYEAFKQIRSEFLTAPYPASTAVVVGFVFPGMLVEIEAIAVRGGRRTSDAQGPG